MNRSALTILWFCLLAAAAPAQAWWNTAWAYRRAVTVSDYRPTKLPGDDVAVATFPTGGLCKPDGGDIRVATAEDQEVACRVLMTGPGDQARVAFAVKGSGRYYVYFGNPKAEPRKDELDIRRGVLLEMWEFPGGPMRTLAQAQDALRRAKNLIGRDFRDRIWSGHNPFGPQSAIASVYTAWLTVPVEGEYAFALSSQNASFLLVDGNLLIDNGGAHGPQMGATNAATVALPAGLIKLTYYHVSNGGDPVVVLAWRPPTESDKRKFTFVPPGAFAPVAKAAPGPLEQYGQTTTIDFLIDHAGETFVRNRYYQRYVFVAQAAGAARALQWKWDFGDGQTSAQERPQHVYLLPGEYTVQLRAGLAGQTLTRTNRLVVARPWDQVTSNRLDSIRDHADIVGKYDFAAMPPAAAAEALILLDRAGAADGVARAGRALLAASQPAGAALVEAVPLYVKALGAAGRSAEAVDALTKAAARSARAGESAALLVQAGRLALDGLDDPNRAADLFGQVLAGNQAIVGAANIRLARIGLGDVYRRRGDGARARQAYEDARPRPMARPGGEPFARGDYARHVEEYIRTRDYQSAEDYLEEWGESFPLDRIEGYWSLLRARLAFERGQLALAAREGPVLAKANPASNYAPEALMLAAEACLRLNQPDRAADIYRQVAKDFPESPLAAQAAKKLEKK